MTMLPLVRTRLFRDAADVKRWHTKRTLRGQTVGQHTFGVMVLIHEVAPDCRKEVLLAAMKHDFPELMTGDIPAPLKHDHYEFGVLLEQIESELAPLYQDFLLTVDEERLLMWADSMELTLWVLEELHMGNRNYEDTIKKILGWITESLKTPLTPWPAVQAFTNEVTAYAAKAGYLPTTTPTEQHHAA